jgi:arylsulfatase A-like enzyme
MATQGIRLTDAHAPAAVCSPTRYGVMTGQYPWRTRPKGGALGVWAAPIIEKGRLTLPGMLKQNGYTTACIGKWHLGWEWPTKDGKPPKTGTNNLSNVDFTKAIAEGPTARGFNYYFGTCVPNYPPYCFIENDRTVGIPDQPSTEFEFTGPKIAGWNQENILPELTRRAVRYIKEASKNKPPFFLFMTLTSPHHPVLPTAEFRGKSGAGDYGDFVVQTDWTCGQVLEAVERAGIADNTLVIFTSDNGPEITRKNVAGTKVVMAVGAYDRIQVYGHASMGPLRGIKYEPWEGGHRVPFLARWPGKIKANSVSAELLCLTDLMATCAAASGAKLPTDAAEDSWNALPVLTGGQGTRAAAVLQSAGLPLAVRQGDWVYINAPAGLKPEPDWYQNERGYTTNTFPGQLYNLREDLSQRMNLFSERADKVRELSDLLDKCQREGRHAPMRQ